MTITRLNEIRKQRIKKLAELKKLGIDPYPSYFEKKQTCAEATLLLGKKAQTAGRIAAIRGHGKIMFLDLVDSSGKIQVWLQKQKLRNYEITKFLDIGDFLGVSGKVVKTKSGERTIDASEFILLSKAIRSLPDKWHGLKDIEERYRKRYLDLILNPETKKVFETRSKILSNIREFLDDQDFLEVETPVLQPMYGGASARPFITHHLALDNDFYLRISNELYLKRLIVGGFDKVYEVSRDFRNEGIGKFHNPEFTQVEFYWAYADYEKLMKFTEVMLITVIKAVNGSLKVKRLNKVYDFKRPWQRLSFSEALKEYTGINMEKITTEADLKREIKNKKVEVNLQKAVGLGAIYEQLYKTYVRPNLEGPLFLIDYPAEMIALAKRKDGDPKKIASFQLLVGGTELLKAYNELNDPIDQKNRWLEEEKKAKLGVEETERLDEDYIEALEYGMPPTAGWGMGIDRLTLFLTDQPTLKDVILFPTLKPKNR